MVMVMVNKSNIVITIAVNMRIMMIIQWHQHTWHLLRFHWYHVFDSYPNDPKWCWYCSVMVSSCGCWFCSWTFFLNRRRRRRKLLKKHRKKIRRIYLRKKVAIERVKSQRMSCHRRTKTQVLMTEGGGILCSIGVIVWMVSLSQAFSWGVYLFGIWHFGQCLVLATGQLLSHKTPANIPYCFLKS